MLRLPYSKIMHRKYTKKEFEEAVKNSKSIRGTLSYLSLKPAGGNYKVFYKYVKQLNIDTSHFTGQLWSKGIKLGFKRPLSDYLSNKFSISSYKLKNRLIKERILESKCSNCLNKTWMKNNIPLELDHIDGNPLNNDLKNLRLLCPNCHALTPNYRGKNKKQR